MAPMSERIPPRDDAAEPSSNGSTPAAGTGNATSEPFPSLKIDFGGAGNAADPVGRRASAGRSR